MTQLNYLKENVPCIEYLYGFCVDGSKECMFHHPCKDEKSRPVYKPNEFLPQEYVDKVKNYFDDT